MIKTPKKKYVYYGCGLSAPKQWDNYDISPTLRLQKIPVLGSMMKGKLNTVFPNNVKYGDIIKGLDIENNFCDGVYCSHTLEHLSLADFRKALSNTYRMLKEGGIFRCVVPDFEQPARAYVESLDNNDPLGSINFFRSTRIGTEKRARGIKGIIVSIFGNANHLWMWDSYSLMQELKEAGFREVRCCDYNDSSDEMFKLVEDEGRFRGSVAIEAIK